MASLISLEDISVLDRQIDSLMDYKPIPEHEVKALCDKVCSITKALSFLGKGNLIEGKQCVIREVSCDSLW